MKKKILAVMLITTMTFSCVACGSKTKSDTSSTKATESTSVSSTEKEEDTKVLPIKAEDLTPLADKDIV